MLRAKRFKPREEKLLDAMGAQEGWRTFTVNILFKDRKDCLCYTKEVFFISEIGYSFIRNGYMQLSSMVIKVIAETGKG